jgi:hypothetical protein
MNSCNRAILKKCVGDNEINFLKSRRSKRFITQLFPLQSVLLHEIGLHRRYTVLHLYSDKRTQRTTADYLLSVSSTPVACQRHCLPTSIAALKIFSNH